MTVYRDI